MRISWDRAKVMSRGCGMKRRGHTIKGTVGQGRKKGGDGWGGDEGGE